MFDTFLVEMNVHICWSLRNWSICMLNFLIVVNCGLPSVHLFDMSLRRRDKNDDHYLSPIHLHCGNILYYLFKFCCDCGAMHFSLL
jgi:hypothetical protein